MDDPDDPNQIKWGTVAENIEEPILESIRKGMSSGEHISIRPLREVFQNCDDEAADRFYIRIDKDALYFLNDGNRLTVEFNRNREPIAGTCRMITGISMASKKRDRDKAGNFGTGLRSAHAISHFIEVHGPTTNLIEIDELDEFGDRKAVLWSENPGGNYFGISNAYNKTLNEKGEAIQFSVRDDKKRPKRTHLNTDLPRDGIFIRLPWRREIVSGSVDPSEWEEYTWNDKKIQRVGELYVQEIPRILLGCSWLREVVLDVNVGKNKSRHAWIRDFNHREFEETNSTNSVNLFSYQGKIDTLNTGLMVDIENDLRLLETEQYQLFSTINQSINEDAEKAQLLPFCHILLPIIPKENLPAYTPIALAGDSGNRFGPIAYLPPDDSRTKIKIDGVNKPKQLWGALAINSFTDLLLPRIFDYTLDKYHNDINTVLNLLPNQVPDKWFSEGRRMGMPSLQSISDQDDYLLNERIKKAWEQLDSSWYEYTEKIANTSIFRNQSGNLVPTQEIIRIKLQDDEKARTLEEIFQALGGNVISFEQKEILSSLDVDDWGENNPLEQMFEISEANHLRIKISEFTDKLNLDILDEEIVRKFIDLIHVNPPSEWDGDVNLDHIPCIPAADGALRPLKDDKGNDIFFLASEKFPDLLPSNRRINEKFAQLASNFKFNNPSAEHLAELINEAAESRPEVFNNLAEHDQIHKQVSKALAIIVTNITQEMRDFKFIPCLHKGKIITRGMSRIEDHVWPIDTFKSVRDNFYRREMILGDSAENRSTLELHPKIHNNLIWLELHPSAENERAKICDKLSIHLAVSAEPGVNIIRSLIFAQMLPGLDLTKPRSVFDKKGNDWGIDDWLEEKLSKKLRDEILESLLKLLASAASRKTHRGMVTGWGGDNRGHVHSLHLLKNKDGKWSTLSDLCYDLDPDLSTLFQKTAVYQLHKEILGIKVITNAVGVSGGCGLGVTHRIDEADITEMIESLKGQSVEVRTKIIDMMLQSETEWAIENLGRIPWVARTDDEFEIFENCILPTTEMIEIFGQNHPWYLMTKCDCSEKNVQSRATELGIMCDHKDVVAIQNALSGPESMWPGMVGNTILDVLKKAYVKDPEKLLKPNRTPRLPDSKTREWKDQSWLVEKKIATDVRTIFNGINILATNELGIGKKGVEMVKNWLLPEPCGPTISKLISKFERYCNPLGGRIEGDVDLDTLKSFWKLFNYFKDEQFPDISEKKKLLFPLGEEILSLHQIMIIAGDQKEIFQEETFSEIYTIEENNEYSKLLKDHFDVIDLSDGTNREELSEQIILMKNNDDFSKLNIQRYWLIIGFAGEEKRLFKEKNWLYYSTRGYEFWDALAHHNPKALIPDSQDSEKEIIRMTNDKLPLFWLPREGEIQTRLYGILGRNCSHNFIAHRARAEIDTDQDIEKKDWPWMTGSIQNILIALNKLHELGDSNFKLGSNYTGITNVNVYRTTEKINSRFVASLSRGASEVYWKDSPKGRPIVMDVNFSEKLLDITINYNDSSLNDDELVERLNFRLDAKFGIVNKLVKYQEDEWGEKIHICLSNIDWKNPRSEPGLLHQATRLEISNKLARLYGQCQICKQITPLNRNGQYQESVVSLFRESGGRYYSQDIKDHPGNFLYLCPNHFALYRRSKNHKLLWFPGLDDVIEQIKKNPTKEMVDSKCKEVLSKRGDIELKVKTYEKRPDDGNEEATDFSWEDPVIWKGEHATEFRDALTLFLSSLVS